MTTALGGSWLSMHGPREPRALLISCLDQGFDGLVPGPGAYPWETLAPLVEDLPLDIPAVRVDPVWDRAGGSLCAGSEAELRPLLLRLEAAARLGRRLQTPLLILEAPRVPLRGEPVPGSDLGRAEADWSVEAQEALRVRLGAERDGFLDRTCRNLHRICGNHPGFRLCLTESWDLCSASEAEDLETVLSDLGPARVGYWPRPALLVRRADFGGTGLGETLETLANHIVGSDLSDCSPEGLLALPGTGRLDYGILAPLLRGQKSARPGVLDLAPSVQPLELGPARGYLQRFGL